MWDYVYFIAYIKNKLYTELNGVEQEVLKKIKILDPGWIPIGKSIVFNNEEIDGNNN